MLSVGNEGDERRISGLGLGYRGRRGMEENELEEGEAVSSLEYDPDASLSYIVRSLAVFFYYRCLLSLFQSLRFQGIFPSHEE